MLLASPCSTPQPLSHGIVQYRLARELVAPVFRLDETGYYLAAVLVQHLKEDTIFAVVHALCRGLVVHFFLGELFFACHWFLSEVVHAEGIEPPCPKGRMGYSHLGLTNSPITCLEDGTV